MHGLNLKSVNSNLELCTIRVPGDTTHGAVIVIVIDDLRSVKRQLNLTQIDGLIGCALEY